MARQGDILSKRFCSHGKGVGRSVEKIGRREGSIEMLDRL